MKANVMIVEDDVIVANNLRDRLRGLGHQVCAMAMSGEDALDRAAALRPDLILMDIKLRGEMDGVTCALEIRARHDIPIIYLTGYADEEILERAKQSEPYGYIVKPFEVRDLYTTIEMALHKHSVEKRLRQSEERYRVELEQQVEERTAALREANRRLVDEISSRRETEWALQRRNRELSLLHRVGQSLTSSLDLDEVLDTALDEARNLLDAIGCTVWLREREGADLVCLKATGPGSAVLQKWHLGTEQGLVGWVAREGKSLIVPDSRADARHFRDIDLETGMEMRSILSVPLRVKQELIGVLQVVDQAPQRFDESDLELLAPLAAWAAVAIENARLYQRASRLAEELRALHAVSQQVSASLSLEEVTRAALEGVMENLAPDMVMLLLMTEDGLHLQGLYPDNATWKEHAPAIQPAGVCLCGLVVERKEAVYSQDIYVDARCTLEACKVAGMQSFAGLPLLKGTDLLGVLGLTSTGERAFAEQDAFLRALAGNIAIGLQNALLHENVQQHANTLESHVARLRQAQVAVRESEVRYRTLFENAPLCLFEVDLDRTPHFILRANQRTESVYGWSPVEITSVGVSTIFASDALPNHPQLVDLLQSGESVTLETRHLRKDGSAFPVRLSATPADAGSRRIILAVEDITAEKSRRSEEAAIAEERRRMAREIHDGLAQNLASLRLRARLWHNLLDEDPAQMHAEVESMRDFLSEQIREVRRSIFALRPVALDELGFCGALREFANDFAEQNRLRLDLRLLGEEGRLPKYLELVLFRIVQEALNNITKHAEATAVTIELDLASADGPALVVRDNGHGFDTATLAHAVQLGHVGLEQMRERVTEMGGTLEVHSQPGQGTEIRVRLPAGHA